MTEDEMVVQLTIMMSVHMDDTPQPEDWGIEEFFEAIPGVEVSDVLMTFIDTEDMVIN